MNNRKIRKIISTILSLAMLTSLITITEINVSANQASTYYVSSEGSDDNTGTTSEQAFKTMANAINKIQEDNNATSGVIEIVGNYSLTDADFGVAHTKDVIIEGSGENPQLYITSNITANGPFTFKNIKLHYEGKGLYIIANGNQVNFGEGTITEGYCSEGYEYGDYQPNFILGSNMGGETGAAQYKTTVDSGLHYNFFLADSVIADAATHNVPGIDFVMNGGTIWNLVIGGNGWEGYWGTNSYTGNVNLTFNGGSVGSSGIALAKYGDTYFQGRTDLNGHALQIIMNNGKGIALNAGITAENVKACNGSLYVLKCAAQTGSTLETTETAGIYKVNGDMVATATATEGTNTYTSKDGFLTVEEPGTYNVTWNNPNKQSVELDDQYINIGEKGIYKLDIASKFEGETIEEIKMDNEIIEDGKELKDCGDYSIIVETADKTYHYQLIQYYKGDGNLDGKRDVKDLIAMRKINDVSKKSAFMGSDMNNDNTVNEYDYSVNRQCLINKLKKTYLFNFSNYSYIEGITTEDPSAFVSVNLEVGEQYTFSFHYNVLGDTTGTTVINAAKEWLHKSYVAFDSTPLSGKGFYSVTFTADSTSVIPVFQSNVHLGKPMFYVWDLSIMKSGTEENLLEDARLSDFHGVLIENDLVSINDLDVDRVGDMTLEQKPIDYKQVWTLDFQNYVGSNADPNVFFTKNVEKGKKYEFSFDYCIEGEARNCTVINAVNAWLGNSEVIFENNQLTKEGTYKQEFTADHEEIIPVFQQHVPQGKAILYIWNLKLVESGQDENLIESLCLDDFAGELCNSGLVTVQQKDINQLFPWGDLEPTTENTAVLYNRQTSSYDENAENKRMEIMDQPDTVENSSTGTKYYISWRGNDDNDGTSPNSPWRSLSKLNENQEQFQEGDAVLFERNGIYRGNINVVSGVSYGAYGTGSKPCLYGSLKNYAARNLWKQTGVPNVWGIELGELKNIGNIIFDYGVKVGTKKMDYTLQNDLDFYYNEENSVLYLYSSEGNPGERFDDIEIGDDTSIIYGKKDTNKVTLENLCVKYTGAHGIHFVTGATSISITGCEIGYVGGSIMTIGERKVGYGNGIEFVDNCNEITVENNWVYQCYDAGITHQSSNTKGCKQVDINFSHNLVEYCCFNIEYYVDVNNGYMKNITYENNILRFSGYGFGNANRIGGDSRMNSNICNYVRKMKSTNFNIRYNIFDTPQRYHTTIGAPNDETYGPMMYNNTFIQKNKEVAKVLIDEVVQELTATDTKGLEACIRQYIDPNPAEISYY